MGEAGYAVVDFGRFCTGFLVVMGVGMLIENLINKVGGKADIFTALPVLLAHCALIQVPAMAMSIIGGLLIYGTIISFTQFFKEEQDF